MREIKFRAWDFTENKMMETIELSYGVQYNKNKIEIISQKDCFIFMQYTGLKDKNGVEIYEGDIIIEKAYPFFGNAPEVTDSNQRCDKLNYVGVVVWDNGYYVDLKAVSNRVRGCAIGQNLYDYNKIEVIGNIYENKELLNG